MADYTVYENLGQLSREQERQKRNLRIILDYLKEHDPEFKRYMRGRKNEKVSAKKK